ncbi:MAG: hypothetical protein COA58_03475 [Bacteroidetes bacterium]|nr:MAG: hypothetical protein COA58_03475 [Bacteroidota bacterium]
MRKLSLLVLTALTFSAFAQSVVTYAGKANDDALNNYESTSGVALLNTFFSYPEGICFDPSGKMYISERNKVRILTNNKLYIRSGSLQSPTFSEGYKNATGTQSTFRNPGGMVCNSNGDVFVADIENHCIRKIAKYTSLGNGQVVTTFAGANPTAGLPGNGTVGSTNGTGTAARFNKPTDITVDAAGNFYVTEYDNFTIRKITPAGVVTTLAGSALIEGTTDGTGSAARFGGPWGVAIYNSNSIVVTDPWNTNIRKINIFSGVTTTLAGPTDGADPQQIDGTLSDARFKAPKGITVVNGIIYVTDQNIIRAIDVDNNTVTTFAGDKSKFSITDGTGSSASFTEMSDIETDGNGNLFVSENSGLVSSSIIRKVTISSLAPAANFETTKQNILTNEKVTLTDISGGQAATSRTWTISPSSYSITTGDLNSESMEISFSVAAFYEVKLSITNDYGTDTKTAENYYAVSTTQTNSVTEYTNSNLAKLYPNPANDELYIELDPSLSISSSTISLFNINGMLVRKINANEIVSTKELPNGTYFVTIVNEDISIAKKLIISHR